MNRSSSTSHLYLSTHVCILSPHFNSLMMERHEIPKISIPKLDRAYLRNRLEVSSSLGAKLLGDIAIGCAVTFSVVPFLTVVDTAIVRKAAGTHTLLSSASDSLKTMVRSPTAYVKSPVFLFMWAVYAATYSTANSLKTIVEHREYFNTKEQTLSSKSNLVNQNRMTVFVGTSLVNTGASLLKDRAYAKLFGTAGAAASVPLISLGLWATRDFMVVGSSFVLPDILSKHLQDEFHMHKGDAQKLSQMTLPILTQFIVGPIQLLGLDFYNRPMTNVSFRDAFINRTRYLIQGFSSVVSARIIRIAPGYGIGGVLNTNARDAWRDYLIQQEVRSSDSGKDDATELVRLVSFLHSSSSYNE
jgi:hypothetical protein